jgi:hypothetical protein
MPDLMNFVILLCASLTSLGTGVLVAYGICKVAFVALRLHARQVTLQTVRSKTTIVSAS